MIPKCLQNEVQNTPKIDLEAIFLPSETHLDDIKNEVDFEGVLDTHGATHGAEGAAHAHLHPPNGARAPAPAERRTRTCARGAERTW